MKREGYETVQAFSGSEGQLRFSLNDSQAPLQRLIGNFYDLSRLELNDYQLLGESVELTRFAKEILLTHFQELERIFTNMVQNALRYAETHSLKAEDVDHLFQRFYVKDSSRTAQSTGLGLTISKLLTEAMGGTAAAKLSENQIQFIFSLPLTDEPFTPQSHEK